MPRTLKRLVFALLLIMPLVVCQPALADQVDQSFLLPSPGPFSSTAAGGDWAAQTFTAGLSGQLTALRFSGLAIRTLQGPVTLSINALFNGGLPGSTVLGTLTFQNGNFFFDSSVIVSLPAGIQVSSGSQYAIVLQTVPGSGLDWDYDFGNQYTPGSAFLTNDGVVWFSLQGGQADLNFETRVNPVPEPATILLLGTGLAGLLLKRRSS